MGNHKYIDGNTGDFKILVTVSVSVCVCVVLCVYTILWDLHAIVLAMYSCTLHEQSGE